MMVMISRMAMMMVGMVKVKMVRMVSPSIQTGYWEILRDKLVQFNPSKSKDYASICIIISISCSYFKIKS